MLAETSGNSKGSDSPRLCRRTDRTVVFARWRRCASLSNACFSITRKSIPDGILWVGSRSVQPFSKVHGRDQYKDTESQESWSTLQRL